jgi:hypothetical protein
MTAAHQAQLDALDLIRAGIRGDQEAYSEISARRGAAEFTEALCAVAGILVTDWADREIRAAGGNVSDDVEDPAFLESVDKALDQLRRELAALEEEDPAGRDGEA